MISAFKNRSKSYDNSFDARSVNQQVQKPWRLTPNRKGSIQDEGIACELYLQPMADQKILELYQTTKNSMTLLINRMP